VVQFADLILACVAARVRDIVPIVRSVLLFAARCSTSDASSFEISVLQDLCRPTPELIAPGVLLSSKCWPAGGMAGPLKELATQVEGASDHKLVFRFGATPELIEMAKSDAPFDLGIVPVDVMKDPAARVRFASEPTTNIARAVLGVAVRSGASKSDISTPTA
jgi:hypothetical protein